MKKEARIKHLVAVVAEEAGELTQVCGKILRFGLRDLHPKTDNVPNIMLLHKEFNELIAVMEMLDVMGVFSEHKCATLYDPHIVDDKKRRVEKWMAYAEEQEIKRDKAAGEVCKNVAGEGPEVNEVAEKYLSQLEQDLKLNGMLDDMIGTLAPGVFKNRRPELLGMIIRLLGPLPPEPTVDTQQLSLFETLEPTAIMRDGDRVFYDGKWLPVHNTTGCNVYVGNHKVRRPVLV